MQAIIYARVSSREQEETGYSLNSQEDLLETYCLKNGFSLVKKFRISESASGKIQRKSFLEMLRFSEKNHINIIVCEKVDRLTRNYKDAVILDEWMEINADRNIHLVKDGLIMNKYSKSQEKLNWGVKLLFAKNYTDNLSEEVKKGQVAKIKLGEYPSQPPLGYLSKGEKGRKKVEIDTEISEYIKIMFKLYASGEYSTSMITEHMNNIGMRTRSGKKLGRSKIHVLLSNPFYYGYFLWNDELHYGIHEPLISKDIFEKVQKILHAKHTGPKKNNETSLLQGKIRCSYCDGKMSWYKKKGHWYGHCNYHGKSKNCAG